MTVDRLLDSLRASQAIGTGKCDVLCIRARNIGCTREHRACGTEHQYVLAAQNSHRSDGIKDVCHTRVLICSKNASSVTHEGADLSATF